jgi:hypothetical protein
MKPIPTGRAPRARTTVAVIATASLVLLATACADGPASTRLGDSSNAAGSASSPSANPALLAFSQCVRSHGVSAFPDPQPGASNAKLPSAQQLGVSSSRYEAAEHACQHLLPAGIDDQVSPAEIPLLLAGMRQFSQCMRSRGVPNWPDPSTGPEGRPVFLLSAHGITRSQARSPHTLATEHECGSLLPGALGGIPVG